MPGPRGSKRDSSGPSSQTPDRIPVVDVVRPARLVLPGGGALDSHGLVNRGGHLLRRLRIARRVAADPIRRADHRAALHAATGEENRLHSAPVVAAWQLARAAEDPRRAAE